jgi:hypothetical protein
MCRSDIHDITRVISPSRRRETNSPRRRRRRQRNEKIRSGLLREGWEPWLLRTAVPPTLLRLCIDGCAGIPSASHPSTPFISWEMMSLAHAANARAWRCTSRPSTAMLLHLVLVAASDAASAANRAPLDQAGALLQDPSRASAKGRELSSCGVAVQPCAAGCQDVSDCYSNTCTYWNGHGYTTDVLIGTYGCPCACVDAPPAPPLPPPAPPSPPAPPAPPPAPPGLPPSPPVYYALLEQDDCNYGASLWLLLHYCCTGASRLLRPATPHSLAQTKHTRACSACGVAYPLPPRPAHSASPLTSLRFPHSDVPDPSQPGAATSPPSMTAQRRPPLWDSRTPARPTTTSTVSHTTHRTATTRAASSSSTRTATI